MVARLGAKEDRPGQIGRFLDDAEILIYLYHVDIVKGIYIIMLVDNLYLHIDTHRIKYRT